MALNQYDDLLEQIARESTPTAPTPAPKPTRYDLLIAETDQSSEQAMRRQEIVGAGTSPDRAAEIVKLAQRTGLPVEVVERNFDDVKLRSRLADTPYTRMLKETPALASWLQQPLHASIAGEDVPSLGALERGLHIGRNLVGALGAGVMDFSQGVWGLVQAGADALAPGSSLQTIARGNAAAAKTLADRARGNDQGGLMESAAYSGIESIGAMGPGLVLSLLTASPVPMLAIAGGSTAGQSYNTAREQGLGPGMAAVHGGIQGAIEVATEYIPAHKLLGALTKKSGLIKTLIGQIASEVPGEEVATALQDLNEWAMLPANKDRTFGDYLRDRPSAAAATAISVLTSVGATVATAHVSQHFIEQLGERAAASTTIERAPEAAAALIDSATQGGAVSTLYAPIDTFVQYWQSKGLDPRQVATELTGDSRAYDVALESGADLAIPTSRYAVKIAPTEHNAFFESEIRLGPELMNGREAEAFAEQQAEREAPPPTPADQVEQAVAQQLTGAGVEAGTAADYAKLHRAAFATLAEDLGEEDAAALYSKYGLRVRRPALDEAAQAATGEASAAPAAAADVPDGSATPDGAPAGPQATGTGQQVEGERQPGDLAEFMRRAEAFGREPDLTLEGATTPALAPLAAAAGVTLSPDGEASDAGAQGSGSAQAAGRQGLPDRGTERTPASALRVRTPSGGDAGAEARGARSIPSTYGPRFAAILDGARGLGYDGSDDSLAALFLEELDKARGIAADLNTLSDDDSSGGTRSLLKAISDAGGFGLEAEGEHGMRGELDTMLESLTNRKQTAVIKRGKRAGDTMKIAPSQGAGLPGIPNIITRKRGYSVDTIREALQQDARFAHLTGSLADFMEAVDDAIRVETGTKAEAESTRYAVEGVLSSLLHVTPGAAWWAEPDLMLREDDATDLNASGESAASLEAIHRQASMQARGERFVVYDRTGARRVVIGPDAVDYHPFPGETFGVDGPNGFQLLEDNGGKAPTPEAVNLLEDAGELADAHDLGGDTTFDISEFDQDLFDLFARDADAPVDVLATGELQPRLPGDVGAVREQEVADKPIAELHDEFRLTAPAETEETQTSLFQAAATITQEQLDAFAADLKAKTGPALVDLKMEAFQNGDVYLSSIVIARGAQRAGLGTEVMRAVVEMADLAGARVTLNRADDPRLTEFYQRFGFVENTGRARDLSALGDMYRDPTARPDEERELYQPAHEDLLIQHNLTAKNLRHALKLGGLPVPSMAITRAHDTLINFGEITLLGSRALADPQGYARTRVFGSDAYSPRYPTVHYKFSRTAEQTLAKRLAPYSELTDKSYFDLDSLQKDGARELQYDARVMAAFLESKGIAVTKATGDDAYYRRVDTRNTMTELIDKNNLNRELEAFAEELFASLGPTEMLFKGFTNMGNRSYKPHTLENVVAELKKDLRGGESEGNLYGVGQLRAKFTPQFKSLAAIKKAKDLIVDDATFDRVKDEVEREFFAISEALGQYYPHEQGFSYTDTVMAVLEDAPRRGLTNALKEYGFDTGVSDAVRSQVAEFLTRLKHMPTEYFEAKVLREVDLGEFVAAVVPADTPADLVEALRGRGVQVVEYQTNAPTEQQRAAERKRVVAETAESFGDRVLFQKEKTARGVIRFGKDRQFSIDLFERADLSTFLHESGHFFLEVFGDVVDRMNAIPDEQRTDKQREVLANYTTLLSWFGVTDRAGIGDAQHEQFARGFEAYLMEGNAPSLELRSAFGQFRAWLMGLYRSLKSLNVKLTPEVRKVMGRMLATERAIQQAQQAGHVEALFTTPESAKVDPAEFELYRKQVADAGRQAREKLELQLMAEVQREQEVQYRARREEVRLEVEAEVFARPAVRVLAAIRRGTTPAGEPLLEGLTPEPLKLSRAMLVERFGADRLKRLPKPALYVNEGGIDPNLVADMFGFSSADAMLTALEEAGSPRRIIDQETDRRMQAEHGSLLLDGTLHERAREAVANESRESVVRAELRMLNKLRRVVKPALQAGAAALQDERREREYERRWFEAESKLRLAIAEARGQEEIDRLRGEIRQLRANARGAGARIEGAIPPASVIRELALKGIAGTKVRDLAPERFWHAAAEASRAATAYAGRQELDKAVAAKQRELLSLAMYREASKARDDVRARVKRAVELGKAPALARLGKAGQSYVDQVRGILDRFEFAQVSKKDLNRRASLRNWIESLEAEGLPADLPEEVLNEALRINFQELTVEQLVGVTDGLQQIAHLARLKNRLLKAKDAREFAIVRDGVVASIHANNEKRPALLEYQTADERRRSLADVFASHTKIATLARIMDGGVDGGAMWESVIRPLNAAGDQEQDRRTTASKAVLEIRDKHYTGREQAGFSTKLEIPAIKGSLSREARLSIALNWGNETSRDRLLSDPRRKWKLPQIEAILDTLDERDWRFVQDVWDYLDSFWPEIAAKQERVTGLAPEKVEALPVTTKYGEMRGGYYPLAYDGRLSARAQGFEAGNTAKLQQAAAYVRTTTKRGHIEARRSHVQLSLKLDLGVMFGHLDQVIHDLTHHEALIDVSRILRDSQVSAAILETRGDVIYRQFTSALQDIATGGAKPGTSYLDRAATFMRTGTQIAGLGWNLWTALQQPLGLFNGMSRVGARWVFRGMGRWLKDAATMESTTKWIADVSPFMRNRHATATQDLAELRAEYGRPGGWFDSAVRAVTLDKVTADTITDSFLWHIGLAQKVADIPTWIGAYEKARHHGNDEARSVALADQAVIDSQGSGQIKDLAQVQRGGPVAKLFMVFYSYGSTLFNSTADVVSRTRFSSPSQVGFMLGHLSLLYVMPALGTVLLSRAFRGTGGDDDSPEEFLADVGREALASALNTMVLVRELQSLVSEGARGYEGPAGTRAIALVTKLGEQLKQGEADDALLRQINAAAGVLFRYPAGQVQRTMDGIAALEEGRTSNLLVLAFGAPKEAKK